MGNISSEAFGATTTAPTTIPESCKENIFIKPSFVPMILALGFVFKGIL